MARIVSTLVAIVVACATPDIWAQPADSPAPMYRLNPANTGQSIYVGLSTDPHVAWTRGLDDSTSRARTLTMSSEGTIYLACEDRVGAIRASDGQNAWDGPTTWRDSNAALDSSGRLYQFERGMLYARRASDGELQWTGPPTNCSDGEPIKIGYDGTIFAVDIGGTFCAYEPNGTRKWKSEEYGWIQYGEAALIPAIDRSGNIYFGGQAAWVSLDSEGEVRWAVPHATDVASTIILGPDGKLYCSVHQALQVRDPDSGALVRQFAADYSLQAIDTEGNFYASKESAIDKYDSEGNLVWEYYHRFMESPLTVDAEGKVYGATADGDIFALSRGGSLLWSIHVTDYDPVLQCAPLIAPGGAVYVVTRSGLTMIVPEPSTLTLLALGAVSLLAHAWRRGACALFSGQRGIRVLRQ